VNELFHTLLYLPPQASSVSHEIDYLHYVVIGSAMAGAFGVTLALVYFFLRYRDRPGMRRKEVRTHESMAFENVAAALTLSLFIGFWVVGFLQYSEIRTPPANASRVYVIAKQWMWEYAYPGGMTTQDELRVPVGEPIELVMTSRDVIHSFYIPAFRLKQDVVPGRMTLLWFTATEPGVYDVFCAEYCGNGHSRMRGRVRVMPRDEYARWIAGNGTEDLASAGERIAADKGCLRCHTVDGSPHIGPTWKGLYDSPVKLAGGGSVRADDAYLTESMMDPMAKIVDGFAPVMPSYLGQLSGPETGAIVEYIRSLRSTP
jgi:cytochrome c oxidase subunit 2